MKYLKEFENYLWDFDFTSLKRGDVISVNDGRYIPFLLYVVLESNENSATIFFIGYLQREYHVNDARLYYDSRKHNKKIIKHKIRNRYTPLIDYKKLTIKQKDLLFEAIYKNKHNYLNVINEKSGFDLRLIEGYNTYFINKESNKYNL